MQVPRYVVLFHIMTFEHAQRTAEDLTAEGIADGFAK